MSPPKDFGFPYTPYSIQTDFMNALYNVLTEGKIGIFESPTGTGKSLSLICGSLRWLKDQQDSENTTNKEQAVEEENSDEPAWLRAYVPVNRQERLKQERRRQRKQQLRERIERVRRGQMIEYSSERSRPRKKQKTTDTRPEEDEFLLDEYMSDNEENEKPMKSHDSNLSKEVRDLLAKLDSDKADNSALDNAYDNNIDDDDDFEELKIYYASRTHSQLSQFVREIHKTMYADDTLTVPLGSRKNLCINKKVQKLKSVQRMNEACLELQKKTTEVSRCPHLPSMNDKPQWENFRDNALAQVRDIEDLVKVGESLNTCPYYGSRHALKPAQLVVLPYQHLLHANTRESLGISLKNSIIIIDEAHNLIETITAIHTMTLTLYQLTNSLSQLAMYLQKYRTRLLGKNIAYIKQIVTIIRAIKSILESPDRTDRVLRVNEFVHMLKIDHINIFKIEKYLKASNLARKLNGFVEKRAEEEQQQQQQQQQTSDAISTTSTVPTLTLIESFLLSLTNADVDGRIVVSFSEGEPQIKYILLNPAQVFEPIVQEAQSIILAGGTMEPISDFINYLFSKVPRERIRSISCGHIIPPNQISVVTLEQGPTGKSFTFTYETRQDLKLMDEVGLAVVNLCNVIPDGVVCFFASFSYLEQVYKRWSSAESGDILNRLSKRKKIFKEPRESNQVESTLRDYAAEIESSSGAVLLCVVNGKMSEGINFSDRLGRGVIMIGLPFANSNSLELREKIKYAAMQGGKEAGTEYYENLCMRGVNQSIGRAIRHKNDYATIVLIDKRYSTPRIRNKLPGWIGDHIETCEKFGKAMTKTVRFFRQFRDEIKN